MNQLSRRAFCRHKVKPASRSHPRRKAQDTLRDRIAPTKIVKQPTVELRGPQISLHFLDVYTHVPDYLPVSSWGDSFWFVRKTLTLRAAGVHESGPRSLRESRCACCGCVRRRGF